MSPSLSRAAALNIQLNRVLCFYFVVINIILCHVSLLVFNLYSNKYVYSCYFVWTVQLSGHHYHQHSMRCVRNATDGGRVSCDGHRSALLLYVCWLCSTIGHQGWQSSVLESSSPILWVSDRGQRNVTLFCVSDSLHNTHWLFVFFSSQNCHSTGHLLSRIRQYIRVWFSVWYRRSIRHDGTWKKVSTI